MQSASGQIWTSWNKIFNLSRGKCVCKSCCRRSARPEQQPEQKASYIHCIQVPVSCSGSDRVIPFCPKIPCFSSLNFLALVWQSLWKGHLSFLPAVRRSQSSFSQSSGKCFQHEQCVTFCQRGGREGRKEWQKRNNQLTRQKVKCREKLSRKGKENKRFHKKNPNRWRKE